MADILIDNKDLVAPMLRIYAQWPLL